MGVKGLKKNIILRSCIIWITSTLFCLSLYNKHVLRANVNMHQKNRASHPKFPFTPTFTFCSPICPNNCGVVFFVTVYFSFWEIIFLVWPLKYENFHYAYYLSYATSCNKFTWPPVFLSVVFSITIPISHKEILTVTL